MKHSVIRWLRHLLPATKHDLRELEKRLMAKVDEVQAQLDTITTGLGAVGDQLTKATNEIVAEIQALKDQIANADVPQGIVDRVDALAAKVEALKPVAQALDDLNPDVT